MKNLTLFLLLAVISISQVKAQEAGNFIVGGNFSFSGENLYSDYLDANQIELTLTPTIAKMINEKVALGLGIGFMYSKSEDNTNYYAGTSDYSLLMIAPFIRIHNNIAGNLKYYIEPGIGIAFNLHDSSPHKTHMYTAGVYAGLLYFVSPKMSVELGVGGITYTYMYDRDSEFHVQNLEVEYEFITPNIGFKYYF